MRGTVAGLLCGSFTMVGAQIREGTSILSEFTCQWSHRSYWCQSCGSLLVAILLWSRLWQKRFSDPLHLWDSSSRLEKVSRCNMLWQNSLADGKCWCSFLCSNDITGILDVENACVISLISRWLQWHQAQCNWAFLEGIRSLQNMWRMATWEGDAAFPTNATRRNESWQIHSCSGD